MSQRETFKVSESMAQTFSGSRENWGRHVSVAKSEGGT
jgi:hypothetical protein